MKKKDSLTLQLLCLIMRNTVVGRAVVTERRRMNEWVPAALSFSVAIHESILDIQVPWGVAVLLAALILKTNSLEF